MLWSAIITCIGFVALVIGVWGRRLGPEPRCRKCEQLVEGLQTPVCPECGADLGKRSAIVHGQRKRNRWVMAMSLLVLVGSGTVFGNKAYRLLTQFQWEHKVPGWWLSDVEMRFATGRRLDSACAGVLFGQQLKHMTPAEFDRGTRIAFDRYLSMRRSGQQPGHTLLSLALKGIAFASQAEQIEATCLSTEIKHTSIDSISSLKHKRIGEVRFLLCPEDWMVRYEYTVHNSAGAPIDNSYKGRYSAYKNGAGSGGGSGGGRAKANQDIGDAPFTCVWTFQLFSKQSNTVPVSTWTETFELEIKSPEQTEPPATENVPNSR